MRIIVDWVVAIIAVILAVSIGHALLPGDITARAVTAADPIPFDSMVVFAVILGLLNALVRPILKLLTFPLTILTLGLFSFVVNAGMFYLAAFLSGRLIVTVLGAFVGAIIVSLVNVVVDVAL